MKKFLRAYLILPYFDHEKKGTPSAPLLSVCQQEQQDSPLSQLSEPCSLPQQQKINSRMMISQRQELLF